MDAHVGGRLEAVAPRPITDPGDRMRLAALLLVSVAVHGWLIAHTYVTARDSVEFARYALQLENPSAAGFEDLPALIKAAKQPPGYPLAVLAVSKVVRAVYAAPLPDQMLLSTQCATAAAGVLLVFPTYWFGRLMFGKFVGFTTAALLQLMPVPAHLTSDGLTEGLYLLFLATAMVFGVRAIKKGNVGSFLQCGLATALTYLVRPEGAIAAAAVGAAALGMGLAGRWPGRSVAARLAALCVGFAIPAVPYIALTKKVSNKPSVDGMFQKFFGNPREQMLNGHGAAPPAAGPALFGMWYSAEKDGDKKLWAVRAVAQEAAKTFFYLPAGLALFGLASATRRFRGEPWLWPPVVFGLMTVPVLLLLAYYTKPFPYISGRHTISLVLVGCPFAAFGLAEVGRRLNPRSDIGSWVMLVALLAACLLGALKSLHAHRIGFVHAGRYLAEHATPDDTILDPFEWSQYYAGRTVRGIPPDPNKRFVYAVMEPPRKDKEGATDDPPHVHLPRYPDAKKVADDGRAVVVYQWPEDVPRADARVLVYKLDTAAPAP